MKYLLQIYSDPDGWSHPIFLRTPEVAAMTAEERRELVGELDTLLKEITESGELVEGQALADPLTARTVRVRDGVPAITDGPFGEAKEQLAGYFIVDCESLERATEIAARFPDARFAAVEVRPLMNPSGDAM